MSMTNSTVLLPSAVEPLPGSLTSYSFIGTVRQLLLFLGYSVGQVRKFTKRRDREYLVLRALTANLVRYDVKA